MIDIRRKSTDTRAIVATLQTNNAPADLTGATVTLAIKHTGTLVETSGRCDLIDDTGGVVRYQPVPTDFSGSGTYQLEWTAVFADGSKAVWPDTGIISVQVTNALVVL